jgi:hypothetical protein
MQKQRSKLLKKAWLGCNPIQKLLTTTVTLNAVKGLPFGSYEFLPTLDILRSRSAGHPDVVKDLQFRSLKNQNFTIRRSFSLPRWGMLRSRSAGRKKKIKTWRPAKALYFCALSQIYGPHAHSSSLLCRCKRPS